MIRKFTKSGQPSHPAKGLPIRVVKAVAESLKSVKINANQTLDCATAAPISAVGGVVGLKGSLAPEGAIVKVADMKRFQFSGPARRIGPADCLDSADAAFAAVASDPSGSGAIFEILAIIGACNSELSAAVGFEIRRKAWTALPNNYQTGALRTYTDQVGPALQGAATYAGGKAEVVCYADI
jgi:Dehydratase family